MSEPINISEARELFEKTTQGEWKARRFAGIEDDTLVGPEVTFVDWQFCCQAHTDYPAMLGELERLRAKVTEYEKFVSRVQYALDRHGDFLIARLRCASRALNEWLKRKAANDGESAGN